MRGWEIPTARFSQHIFILNIFGVSTFPAVFLMIYLNSLLDPIFISSILVFRRLFRSHFLLYVYFLFFVFTIFQIYFLLLTIFILQRGCSLVCFFHLFRMVMLVWILILFNVLDFWPIFFSPFLFFVNLYCYLSFFVLANFVFFKRFSVRTKDTPILSVPCAAFLRPAGDLKSPGPTTLRIDFSY